MYFIPSLMGSQGKAERSRVTFVFTAHILFQTKPQTQAETFKILHSQIISSVKETKLQEQFLADIKTKFHFPYHFFSSSCASLNMSCVCINDSFCLHALPLCASSLCHGWSPVCLHSPEKATHPPPCSRAPIPPSISFTLLPPSVSSLRPLLAYIILHGHVYAFFILVVLETSTFHSRCRIKVC